MEITLKEQETTINLLREDDWLTVYTSDKTFMTKLHRLLGNAGTEWKLINETDYSMEVKAPKTVLTLRTSSPKGRKMSDEEKEKLVERLQGGRK